MRRKYLLGGLLVFFLSSTFLLTVFQNCSKIDFNSTDELIQAGVDGELRMISLNPEQNENRPSIQVSTILDNSNSMKPIQDQVASAFQSVTGRLRGFSGEMSLYTTTQSLTGDRTSVELHDLIRYQGPDGWLEIPAGQIGSLSPSTDYWNVKKYTVSKSHSLTGYPLPFWSHMNDSEFDEFTNEYASSISDIGVAGDDKEQGLCTLMRAIEAHKDSQAFQAFILATNEDDASDLEGCLDEKSQEVVKELKDPVTAACEEGDEGCSFTYEMDFLPNKEHRLSYSYRKVTETLKYQSKTPNESWQVKYRWRRHRRYYYYKIKQRKEWVSFRRYALVDNIPEPENVNRVFNYNNNQAVNGYCSAESPAGQAVSCDDVLASIPASQRPYGLVPGSCKVHCQNQLSSQMSKAITNYDGGSCSENNQTEGYRNCTGSEPANLAGLVNLDQNDITSCQHRCRTDGTSLRTATLSQKPGNCGQTCNGDQRNFADSKSPSYIDSGDIYECNIQCNESYPWRTITLSDRNIYQCNGLQPDQGGSTGAVSCIGDGDLQQIAADHLGTGNINDIRDCSYSCSHSIRNEIKPIANPSSCSIGKLACSVSEWNLAVQHFLSGSGTSELFMISDGCESECRELTPRPKCTGKKYDSGNMCEGGINDLASSCAASGHNLNLDSCRHDGGYKVTPSTEYEAVAGNWGTKSMIDESGSPVQTVANRLHSAFGDRYFVASFAVPPGDPECEPENEYIDPAHKYSQLAGVLGEGNSRIYPVCMDSYDDALSFVLDLVARWTSRSYQLNIDPGTEWIWRVKLIYGTGQVEEVAKDLYQVEKGVLRFHDDMALEGVTRIDIEVVTPRD